MMNQYICSHIDLLIFVYKFDLYDDALCALAKDMLSFLSR